MGIPHLKAPWKPGQSGNPSGKPKLPAELRAIQSLTRPEICKLVSKYGRMNRDELDTAKADPRLAIIDACFITVYEKILQYGDPARLMFLLDQAMGKINPARDDEEARARKEIQDMSDQELIRVVEENLPRLKATGE